MTTRRAILLALMTIGFAMAARPAPAQMLPGRPIKIVVPFPAGGPTDLLARIVSQRLSAGLGKASSSKTKRARAAEPDRKRSRAQIRTAPRCCWEAPTPMP